jgi:hypothetical protein
MCTTHFQIPAAGNRSNLPFKSLEMQIIAVHATCLLVHDTRCAFRVDKNMNIILPLGNLEVVKVGDVNLVDVAPSFNRIKVSRQS